MRFRLAGTGWKVAPSLARLLVQVDEEWPVRHAADGTLGNAAHSNRLSDHNPDLLGIVRAGDVGEVTEDDAFALAEAVRLSRDVRVKYVIHERRMYSSYWKNGIAPYTWREYTGSNGHWSHVHFSTLKLYDDDTRPWTITGEEEDMTTAAEVRAIVKEELEIKFGPTWKVNGRTYVKAVVDSVWHARSKGRSLLETINGIYDAAAHVAKHFSHNDHE